MCLPGCTQAFCTVDNSINVRSKVQTHSWHLPNRNMEAFRGRAVGRNVRAVGDLCLCQYIISFFTWIFLIVIPSFRALKLSCIVILEHAKHTDGRAKPSVSTNRAAPTFWPRVAASIRSVQSDILYLGMSICACKLLWV